MSHSLIDHDTLCALERTDWFAGSQQPVRSGVYERKYGFGMSMLVLFSYWDNNLKLWGVSGHTPEVAYNHWRAGLRVNRNWFPDAPSSWEASRQSLPWRGLDAEWAA